MIIQDRIYGTYKITSPVILELIHSKPVQRLRKISQMGPPDKYYHLKGYRRYEHSIGVMLLLKHLGADKEEQIAGLLHDISHTTFSHLIDWVVGTGQTEEFQDNQHEKYFLNSDVKNILVKYNYNPKRICNNKNFSLLEREIPDLCVDRIDYAIREFPLLIAKKCFSGFATYKKRIVFNNRKLSYLFATNFLIRQLTHWGGFEAVTRYIHFAKVLNIALEQKLININDFMENEEFIIEKIESSSNKEIKNILFTLKRKSLRFLPKSRKKYRKKFRFVDPEFIENGKVIRLSQVDQKFKDQIEKARKQNEKGISVGLIVKKNFNYLNN